MNADEITRRLPPLRTDEPSTLRQDIVDEILDHLNCGIRRELLVSGGDEETAGQRALAKFGNPQEIARKLWFQAMWSNIMSQRLFVGSAMFTMLICVLIVGMMGWLMHQQQQANAALLENIAKLIPARAETTPPVAFSSGKSHLQLKINYGTETGPPAKGCEVVIRRLKDLDTPTNASSMAAKVEDSDTIDCGYTNPGRFSVTVTTPQKEKVRIPFLIRPDEDHLEKIVVPNELPPMTRVEFEFQGFPNDLSDCPLGLVMRIRPQGSRKFGNRSWKPIGRWTSVPMPILFLSDRRYLLTSVEPDYGTNWSNDGWDITMLEAVKNRKWVDGNGEEFESAIAENLSLITVTNEWSLPVGEYSAQFGMIVLNESAGGALNLPEIHPATGQRLVDCWMLRKGLEFVASPGKLNRWKIDLPDHIIRCLRDPSKIREVLAVAYLDDSSDEEEDSTQSMGGGGGFF